MLLVVYLVSFCKVSGVGVYFPSGRICLGYRWFSCVGGDSLGLGARVIVFAWGDWDCVYLGRDLGVFGVLVLLLFFFFLFCMFFTSSCSGISVPPALYDLL